MMLFSTFLEMIFFFMFLLPNLISSCRSTYPNTFFFIKLISDSMTNLHRKHKTVKEPVVANQERYCTRRHLCCPQSRCKAGSQTPEKENFTLGLTDFVLRAVYSTLSLPQLRVFFDFLSLSFTAFHISCGVRHIPQVHIGVCILIWSPYMSCFI